MQDKERRLLVCYWNIDYQTSLQFIVLHHLALMLLYLYWAYVDVSQ